MVEKPAFHPAQPLSLSSRAAIFVRDPTVAMAESGENAVSLFDCVTGSLVDRRARVSNHCQISVSGPISKALRVWQEDVEADFAHI